MAVDGQSPVGRAGRLQTRGGPAARGARPPGRRARGGRGARGRTARRNVKADGRAGGAPDDGRRSARALRRAGGVAVRGHGDSAGPAVDLSLGPGPGRARPEPERRPGEPGRGRRRRLVGTRTRRHRPRVEIAVRGRRDRRPETALFVRHELLDRRFRTESTDGAIGAGPRMVRRRVTGQVLAPGRARRGRRRFPETADGAPLAHGPVDTQVHEPKGRRRG